jgi:hypothetical protein
VVINLKRLPKFSKIIAETTNGVIYEIVVFDPEGGILSIDSSCRILPDRQLAFLASENAIQLGGNLTFEFMTIKRFVAGPWRTATVYLATGSQYTVF